MATTSTYLFPTTDDTMDVSSPGNRTQDDDIDIDFDYDDTTQIEAADDENMVDDNEETGGDDMMEDDEAQTILPTHSTTILDEDLIDYSDDEDQGIPTDIVSKTEVIHNANEQHSAIEAPIGTQPGGDVTVVENQSDAQAENAPSFQEHNDLLDDTEVVLAEFDELVDDAKAVDQEQAYTVPAGQAKEPGLATDADKDLAVQHDIVKQACTKEQGVEDGKEHITSKEVRDEDLRKEQVQNVSDQNQELESEALPHIEGSKQQESTRSTDHISEKTLEYVNTDTNTTLTTVDGPGTPTDTGLHPVMFYYEDSAYPLFRSRTSPDGLIKDDNMVSVSLADFIKVCRQRLAIKMNEEIGDHHELHLTFEILNLTVIEDSPASFRTSLKDVLDVFVQLHENDGYATHEIPALEITCTLQIKFDNSIVLLRAAAAGGTGISSFSQTEQQDHLDIQHDDQDKELQTEGYEYDEDERDEVNDEHYDHTEGEVLEEHDEAYADEEDEQFDDLVKEEDAGAQHLHDAAEVDDEALDVTEPKVNPEELYEDEEFIDHTVHVDNPDLSIVQSSAAKPSAATDLLEDDEEEGEEEEGEEKGKEEDFNNEEYDDDALNGHAPDQDVTANLNDDASNSKQAYHDPTTSPDDATTTNTSIKAVASESISKGVNTEDEIDLDFDEDEKTGPSTSITPIKRTREESEDDMTATKRRRSS